MTIKNQLINKLIHPSLIKLQDNVFHQRDKGKVKVQRKLEKMMFKKIRIMIFIIYKMKKNLPPMKKLIRSMYKQILMIVIRIHLKLRFKIYLKKLLKTYPKSKQKTYLKIELMTMMKKVPYHPNQAQIVRVQVRIVLSHLSQVLHLLLLLQQLHHTRSRRGENIRRRKKTRKRKARKIIRRNPRGGSMKKK